MFCIKREIEMYGYNIQLWINHMEITKLVLEFIGNHNERRLLFYCSNYITSNHLILHRSMPSFWRKIPEIYAMNIITLGIDLALKLPNLIVSHFLVFIFPSDYILLHLQIWTTTFYAATTKYNYNTMFSNYNILLL